MVATTHGAQGEGSMPLRESDLCRVGDNGKTSDSVGPHVYDIVSGIPGWPQTHYVTDNDLELLKLLTPPPDNWNYGDVPPPSFDI